MMKLPLPLLTGVLGLAVVGCGIHSGAGSGSHPSGTGPFDSRGNYVEAWADNPSKWNGRSVPEESVPAEEPTEIASNDTPPVVQARPQATTQVSQPKPKPKPKPKPQPSAVYHTVRKGDTLYGLSKRYGTTVGAIQRANGISGSVIRIGQRIKIPR